MVAAPANLGMGARRWGTNGEPKLQGRQKLRHLASRCRFEGKVQGLGKMVTEPTGSWWERGQDDRSEP